MEHPITGRRNSNGAFENAFTLVELLVVICITAVLSAIMLALFKNAEPDARQLTCMSNLKQIATAIQMYVQDYDGAYPMERSVEIVKGKPVQLRWENAITPYLKTTKVFQCPAHPQAPFEDEDYTYNGRRLNTIVPRLPKAHFSGNQEAALPDTSIVWMAMDSGYISGDGTLHYLREVTNTSCGRPFFGSILHRDGGNYAFADGHVSWLKPEAIAEIECKNGPLPFPYRN